MAVKSCMNCGEDNQETAVLCIHCHHSLAGSAAFGVPDSEKRYGSRAKVICSQCSERLEEGAFKCRYCGSLTVQPSRSRKSYDYPAASEGSALFLLFASTFLIPLVGLIVGGFYALDDDAGKSDIGKGLLLFGLVMVVVDSLLIAFFV